MNNLRRFGGAVPRAIGKLRRGEKLFVQIRGRDAWEKDYREHKWDQLISKSAEAGNLAVIAHMLAFALRKPQSRLLDVGCGNGVLLKLLQGLRLEVDYLGTDISAESLAQLNSQFPDAKTLCADMANVDEVPGRFDVVVINECLFHAEYAKVIEAYRHKVGPDGFMIVSMVQNPGRTFIWRAIAKRMNEIMSFTIRNDRVKHVWTVKLLRYN
jgi:2-polyprenyl-3-methyl-5-hydroxy-6-metoxy-1,4-benzoquinol methylase